MFEDRSRQELLEMAEDDHAVILAFYEELRRLGLMPDGVFVWTQDGARLFAQGILKKCRQAIGRRGGLKGGPARAAKLSKERRQEIASEAVKARWEKNGGRNRDAEDEEPDSG
jgi:hypothetical protein